MKKKKLNKFFSAFLTLIMVFTMLSPMNVFANTGDKLNIQNATNESKIQAEKAINEQLALRNVQATLHEDLQELTGEEEVAVIIHLSENSVALEKGIKELSGKKFTASDASSAERKVNTQQILVEKEMKAKNISIKEGYSFHTVLNGFGAKVKASDLKKILSIQGVTLVEPDEIRYALDSEEESVNVDAVNGNIGEANNTSISHLGIEKVWARGFKGKGIKVGVVDTGIDYTHPEFVGVYKGGKNFVPHDVGGDYSRPRDDNDPYETAPLDRDPNNPNTPVTQAGSTFATSHGTHVSGTIAGIGANEYGISGLSPEVELHVYRVLGAYGSGYTSWVIRGIEAAVEEGMDVINLSLGGPSMSSVTADAFAINNAMLAGTVAAVATGNSGSARGSIGSPATAALGIAVGNSTNPAITETGATLTVKAESYGKSYDLNYMAYKFGAKPGEQLTGEYDLVAVPNVGAPIDYEGLDVNGKVVLVSRGETAFVDKIDVAKKAGAVAVIIHNNAGTGLINSNQGSGFAFITTFDMSLPEGTLLRTALASKPGKISFSNFKNTVSGGDTLSSSSSRGPTNPDFDIKPDVVAPGTNIMSTIPMYGKDVPGADYSGAFGRKSGTSMATPHIAAISALMLQANPTWTPFDVKVSLSNTAKLLNTTTYDVFAQGPGRVQPYEAAFPTVLAYALDSNEIQRKVIAHEKGTVRFGKQSKISTEDISVTKQIRVEDFAKLGGDYTVDVQITKAFAGATVTVNKPTFKLNGSEMIDVTLKAPKTTVTAAAEILGYIYVKGNGKEISLPFAAEFTPNNVKAVGVSSVKVSDYDLSFNSESTKKSSTVSGVLGGTGTTRYGEISVELSDLLNHGDEIGTIYNKAGSFTSGQLSYPINGTYTNGDGNIVKMADGAYSLAIYASNTSGSTWYGDADPEPLFVKSTPATIDTAKSHETVKPEYQFNGTVVDDYINFIKALVAIGYKFDVNEKLSVMFKVVNAKGEKIGEGPVTLEQDGKFSLDLTNLTLGENIVTIYVNDAAGNKAEQSFEVAYSEPVVTLSVNPTKLDLTTGGTAQLAVTETSTPATGGATNKDVTAAATYVVADESVAKVTNGLVTAVAKGSTTITISHGANKVTVNVTVKDSVVVVPGVTLTANNTQIGLEPGKEAQLTITEVTTTSDGKTTQKDVTKAATYKVVDSKVASVTNGLVTAKNEGSTTITVKYGKNELTVNVTVKAPVVTLTANKTELNLDPGKEAQLTIKEVITAADGTTKQTDVTKAATYKVADGKVVSVTNGLVTANAAGKTTITVKHGKNELTVNVNVAEPGVKLTTNKTDIVLDPGKESQMTIKEVTTGADGKEKQTDVTKFATYVVADEKVASVKSGLVIAKAAGSTTITVKYGKNELTVNVKVIEPQVTLTTNKTDIVLEPEKESKLTIKQVTTTADGKTKEVDVTNFATYTVADSKVASVSSTGIVRAEAVGGTTVTVKYGKNELTVNVQVAEPVVTLSVNKTKIDLEPGKEFQLTVKEQTILLDGKITEKNVTKAATYTVKNGKVATVTDGLIRAKAEGTTEITVKHGKNELTVKVNVTEPVMTLDANVTQLDLEVGNEVQLTMKEVTTTADGKVTEKDVTTAATYKVADAKVASVTNGLVKAKAEGSTTITVKYGKNEVTITVTVAAPKVTLVTDQAKLELKPGKESQLTLKEVTTMPDGTTSERDVTTSANYTVANSKVASVSNGLVRAKAEGTTTITVKYGKNEVTIEVIVGNPLIVGKLEVN
ncbi:S8 family serine peptidase [Psychrobacillus sp. L3]|uniref:S8 family serine peptidase n=1 Tax=Psychrobacillus sp. L3 TaxID=3236891 RepID=UPI0036F44D1E